MPDTIAPLEVLEPMHDSLFDLCESFDPTTATTATPTPDPTPDHPEPHAS
jgi:hypothetical protein